MLQLIQAGGYRASFRVDDDSGIRLTGGVNSSETQLLEAIKDMEEQVKENMKGKVYRGKPTYRLIGIKTIGKYEKLSSVEFDSLLEVLENSPNHELFRKFQQAKRVMNATTLRDPEGEKASVQMEKDAMQAWGQ